MKKSVKGQVRFVSAPGPRALIGSVCLVLSAGLLLAACGTGPGGGTNAASNQRHQPPTPEEGTFPATTLPVTTEPPSIGYGYLYAGSSIVAFLELTGQSQGNLSGFIYGNALSGSPPDETVVTDTNSFMGTVAEGKLTVNFSSDSVPVVGRMRGGTIQLEVPQSDGSLAEHTYTKATPGQYDVALSGLRQQANAANQQAQQENQEEAAIDQASETIGSDVSTLTGDDPSTIGDDVSTLGDDLTTVGDDLTTVRDDYATFQNDLAQNNDACSDVGSLDQDAPTVAGDAQTLWNDSHSGLLEDISSLEQSMSTARSDWTTYEYAQAVLPTYQPSETVPSLSSTLATAQSGISAAVKQANSDIGEANGIVAQAYGLANKANQIGHCGQPANSPPPLGPIAPPPA